MHVSRLPRRPQPTQAQKDAAWAELQHAQEELADLRAFRAEVLDVCSAPPALMTCPACNGQRVTTHVRDDRCYYLDCTACGGHGLVIA